MEQRATPPAVAGTFRFAAGTVLAGRYRVIRALARGGMGEVYEVEDQQLHEVVALKTLDERLSSDAHALDRFQSEVKNARRISHPNVCRTFDFGVHENDAHFLTMELLSGEGLDARLQRGPLERDEFLEVMSQVAAAIDAAHAAGVVHRDLKPSNVMLVRNSGGGLRAVVSDFGIARHTDDTTITRDRGMGTPAYVAPEQLTGNHRVGPAADLYALGVMLFEASSGRLPFEGTSVEMTMQRLARAAPSLADVAPKLPAAWGEAIARCLEREPQNRPILASDAVLAMRGAVPLRRRLLRSRASRRALLLTGALLLATLGFFFRPRERLPATARSVSVEFVADEGVASPSLLQGAPDFETTAAWITAHRWKGLEQRRRFRVALDASGNVVARVRWRPASEGVALTLEVGTREWRRPLGDVQAASVREAADLLFPRLAEFVGEGQRDVELFPEEFDELRELAAPNAAAFKELISVFDEHWRMYSVDVVPLCNRLQALADQHPDWAQVAAYRMWTLGQNDASRAFGEKHLAAAKKTNRDPVGIRLLELTIRRTDSGWIGQNEVGLGKGNRLAMLAGYLFGFGSDELSTGIAELADRFPTHQFAQVSYTTMAHQGLTAQAERRLTEWLRVAPGQEQAWLSLLYHRSRFNAVEPRVAVVPLTLLFGTSQAFRLTVAAIYLARFEVADAQEFLMPMLGHTAYWRAQAQFTLGQSLSLSGKFSRAVEALTRGREAALTEPAIVTDFAWIQTARELSRLYTRLDKPDLAQRWRKEQIELIDRFVWSPAERAGARAEADWFATGKCPNRAALNTAKVESERSAVDRVLVRVSARYGCAPCDEVIRAGTLADESALPWTSEFARCAVEQKTGLEEARRAMIGLEAYEINVLGTLDPAVDEFVRSTYWLGRVLEEKGDLAGAKQRYQRVVQLWGEADRPVPNVDDAKARLAGK